MNNQYWETITPILSKCLWSQLCVFGICLMNSFDIHHLHVSSTPFIISDILSPLDYQIIFSPVQVMCHYQLWIGRWRRRRVSYTSNDRERERECTGWKKKRYETSVRVSERRERWTSLGIVVTKGEAIDKNEKRTL